MRYIISHLSVTHRDPSSDTCKLANLATCKECNNKQVPE